MPEDPRSSSSDEPTFTLSSGCVFFDIKVSHPAEMPVQDCPVCSQSLASLLLNADPTVAINGGLDFVRSDEWWKNLVELEGENDFISAGGAEFPEFENPCAAIREIQEAASTVMADPKFTNYPAHLRAGAFADDDPEVHAAYDKGES